MSGALAVGGSGVAAPATGATGFASDGGDDGDGDVDVSIVLTMVRMMMKMVALTQQMMMVTLHPRQN